MIPDEGCRLQRLKLCKNKNQDEDIPNNTTHTNNASSKKYRDIRYQEFDHKIIPRAREPP